MRKRDGFYSAQMGTGDAGRTIARLVFNCASRFLDGLKLEVAPTERRSPILDYMDAPAHGRIAHSRVDVEPDEKHSYIACREQWHADVLELAAEHDLAARALSHVLEQPHASIEAAWRIGGREALRAFFPR